MLVAESTLFDLPDEGLRQNALGSRPERIGISG